jgi:aldehyde dehydrogenase (NAD+)
VNEKHYNRLVGYLNDAVEGGAKVEIGGGTNAADNFIEPTLLTNVDDSMLVMKEEIFGPILPMMEYDRLEEVIDYINEKDKPLALYMNSRKKQNIDLLLKKTSAGDALINEFLLQFGNHELPFGGVNNSGIGKSNGFFGFQEFSNMKGVMKRRFGNMNFLFPPYTDKIDKLVSWAVKYV